MINISFFLSGECSRGLPCIPKSTSGRATLWDREARLSSAKSGAAGSATLLLPTTTMSAAVCKMKR